MCLMPLPVKIKDSPTTKSKPKPNKINTITTTTTKTTTKTATATSTTITPPRIILDPTQNQNQNQNPHLHRIAMLPPHIKTTSPRILSEIPIPTPIPPVPALYLTTQPPTPIHSFEDGFLNVYPGAAFTLHQGVKKDLEKDTEKEKEKEKEKQKEGGRRSSILRDIEFIKLVSEGVGSLRNTNPGSTSKDKKTEEEKEKEKEKEKLAGEKKMVEEVVGALKDDIKFLKEGWVKKEREAEVGRVRDVARAEGKVEGVKEGVERVEKARNEEERVEEKIRGGIERRERDFELEILRREAADFNRRGSWGRRDSYGFGGNHHGNANVIGNDGTARMLWHFHTHADIGGNGRAGTGNERNDRRRRDERDNEYERGYHHDRYERMEMPYERERRRSSLVSLRSLRAVVDRVIRRDVEAEILEREMRDERRERRRFGRRRRVDFDF